MHCKQCFLALAAVVCCLGAEICPAETDEGMTGFYPWSGFWWQHKAGGLTGPLTKYDQYRATQAAAWERENHVGRSAEDWFGHCHAWAASSVWEKEPQQPRTLGSVSFAVGDQKGLLAACHAQDLANSFGRRYSGAADDDLSDIRPDELWRVLQLYVKQQRIPIILDLEAREAVWNYPVYQYRLDYDRGNDGWYYANLQLVVADDNVVPDYVGTQPMVFAYTFRFQMQDGAVVAGTAQWTGNSVTDHPDFAWYPYVAVAENPDIDAAEVSGIVGFPVGADQRRPDDPRPTPPTPTPPPTPPSPPTSPAPTPPALPPPTSPAPPPSIQDTLSLDEFLAAVTNRTSSFEFDVFVDKGDGGRYGANQPIRVSFQSAKAGYLYVFDIDPSGDVSLIFPLADQQNYIQGGVLYDLPPKTLTPSFLAGAPGQHDLKAIVASRPIHITGFRGLPRAERTASEKEDATRLQLGQKPSAMTVPQPMHVYPSAQVRVRRRLIGCFRKGESDQPAATAKIGAFAQDLCSYFVLPDATNQTPPGQSPAPR